jgi:hypothetical protein
MHVVSFLSLMTNNKRSKITALLTTENADTVRINIVNIKINTEKINNFSSVTVLHR